MARKPKKPAGKPAAKKSRHGKRQRRDARAPGRFDRAVGGAVKALFRLLFWLGFRIALILFVILAGAVTYYLVKLPPASELLDARTHGSVTMLDRNGDVFAWRGAQFGGEIGPGDVSPHLVDAILAAEDRRFYSHFGVDPRGLLRAMLVNLRAGRFVQGGSTITQQVAKNVFLTSERTLERKLKEVPVALALELKYTKDEILSIYMNRVYLGAGATGFEAASQRYFSKSAKFVTIPEAAMLAGLLKAPTRFAPTSDMGRAEGRAAVIISAMVETGAITESEAVAALARPARLSEEAARRTGGHFADWVMDSGPAFLTATTTEDVRITTTFDPKIQAAAEAGLKTVFETKVKEGSPAEAAVVVMTPSGEVRALIGGRDPAAGAFNRAVQALRQTGSAFKPIVYAAALEAGYSPLDVMVDRPLTIHIPGSGPWSPENYGGGYEGEVTLTTALAHSINTVAVRLSERVGREKVRRLAAEMGITSPIAEGPAVALGVSEATLLEMTGVYAVIANGGYRAPPRGITEITIRGDEAPVMSAADTGAGAQVISEASAGQLTGMMEEVVRSGTGRRADPGRPAAGKTGTTQGARDAWFIGFTADYVVGVWMGKDDNEPLTGVTGGGLPAGIWREIAIRINEGLPPRPLKTSPPRGGAVVAGRDGRPAPQAAREQRGVVTSVVNGVFELFGGESDDASQPERERIER
ncbi:penicillin-binding protein [Pikeienuella piscinae]|uniref:Penicillin-binding protein n=1 Tax=Pikeienuella piscinae TaxID=2748098 RepID=A0A7M3T629_9RHOB|nr:transglycosylase domain-containing protein [Pikeienuella piscinae]QIE57460.1 penicillin-binding protein [Pikeienuella piscinae]